ncbi:NAD-dependent epimerase/dehydratase family protein [Cognatitamlana onchidii]|uniref:NAD-dependent epimerase/dehydratase family protein n=1 Tax=Cognatitamlana onchidii TaxID=2562860 RepID=UPI0010A5FB4B|nr:NAD-dependent epimerase/dehydratase family protein [Algibacter onchidii]
MILVTGGTGLVGAHLLFKLASNHNRVRAIYRNEKKLVNTKKVFECYTKNYKSIFESIDWIQADILDIPALSEAFKDVTKVYHCAAFVSFEPNKYQLLRKINIEGTANIVNLSISHNIKKLCYVSSIATLGRPLNNDYIDENTNWNPEADNHVYAITKYGAEIEVWRGTQEGLNAVIVNPGLIIGAGIWKYGSGSLFTKAKKGLKFYTNGTVGLVSVKDVVNIMINLMESKITNERFVLVSENWTYKDFLQSLSKSVNGRIPEKLASKSMLGLVWRLDWLKHKITGKRRQLTKHIAHALQTKSNFNSQKIKTTVDYNFEPMTEVLTQVGQVYLKQD